MSSTSDPKSVIIVGAGLVGALCSAMLSRRGWSVTLLESRPDPRLEPASSRSRSINLALSDRGIESLRSVSAELADRVLKEGTGMRGRMLHLKPDRKGKMKKEGQDYGIVEEGEMIYSISRSKLGMDLLDFVEEEGGVEIVFGAKLVEMDMRGEKGVTVTIKEREDGIVSERTLECDWIVGADGAYSQTRRQMMRGIRFDYKQNYALHSYLELSIPPGPNQTYSIEPNYLHIWPRGEFMLIALANLDRSFTLTLFAPQPTFIKLSSDLEISKLLPGSPNPIVTLFQDEFPDALELMGEEGLLSAWENNPKDGLITVECSPYHYQDKALLIGDAAHAMVPFYGQGMNCGFEDVRVLSNLLDQFAASPLSTPHPPSPLPLSSTPIPSLNLPLSPSTTPLALALSAYTTVRTPSLKAIQSLAQSNYQEMSSKVLDPLYLLRLSLDRILSKVFKPSEEDRRRGLGGKWESLYRMTTFRWGLSYEEVLRRREWQQGVLEGTAVVVGTAGVGLGYVSWLLWKGNGWDPQPHHFLLSQRVLVMAEGRPRRSIGSTSYAHLLIPPSLGSSSGSDSDSDASREQNKSNGKGKGRAVNDSSADETDVSVFEIESEAGSANRAASESEEFSVVDEDDDDVVTGEDDEEGESWDDATDPGSEDGGKRKGRKSGGKTSSSKRTGSTQGRTKQVKPKTENAQASLALPSRAPIANKRSQPPSSISGAASIPHANRSLYSIQSQFTHYAGPRFSPPIRRLITTSKGAMESDPIEEYAPLSHIQRLRLYEVWSWDTGGPNSKILCDLGFWRGKFDDETRKMKSIWGGWYPEVKVPASLQPIKQASKYEPYFPRQVFTSTPATIFNATSNPATEVEVDATMEVDTDPTSSDLTSSAIKIYLGSMAKGPEAQTLHVIERFEAKRLDEFLSDKPGFMFNAGGPVSAVSWCPTTDVLDRDREYLAISTLSTPQTISHSPSPYPALIQILSLDTSSSSDLHRKTSEPRGGGLKLELGLCIEIGEAWDLKWCPKGGDGNVAPTNEDSTLGVLAGVFTDGSVSLFAVPNPSKVKRTSNEAAFVKAKPVLQLTLPETSCFTFDWMSSETIVAGCTNGSVAMWDVSSALRRGASTARPIRYFPVHTAAIKCVTVMRIAPLSKSLDGSFDLNVDPVTIVTCGYDGNVFMVDVRNPNAQMMLSHERSAVRACAFYPSTGSVLVDNSDDNVELIVTEPANFGTSKRLHGHKGAITSIATSDYHPYFLSTSCDGSVVIANAVRTLRKRHNFNNNFRKLYRIDFNRKTGEYRMLDNYKPEPTAIDHPSNQTLKKAKGKKSSDPSNIAFWETSLSVGAWSAEVAVLKAAFHPNIRKSCLVASGMACGIVRVDWTEGLPLGTEWVLINDSEEESD